MRVNIGCTPNSSSALKNTAAVKMPSVTACVRAFECRVGFRVIAILKGRTTAIGRLCSKGVIVVKNQLPRCIENRNPCGFRDPGQPCSGRGPAVSRGMAVVLDLVNNPRPRHPEKARRPDSPLHKKPDWIRVK